MTDTTKCWTCNGKGVVMADLRSFGFGPGFTEFMAAGTTVRRNEDGSAWHEIVCPRCDGTVTEKVSR